MTISLENCIMTVIICDIEHLLYHNYDLWLIHFFDFSFGVSFYKRFSIKKMSLFLLKNLNKISAKSYKHIFEQYSEIVRVIHVTKNIHTHTHPFYI